MTEQAQILTSQGFKLLEQKNFEGAIDRFQVLMQLEGESIETLRNLGHAYEEAGQELNSYNSYWKAYVLDQTDRETVLALSRNLVALKLKKKATAILERYLDEVGDDGDIRALQSSISNE